MRFFIRTSSEYGQRWVCYDKPIAIKCKNTIMLITSLVSMVQLTEERKKQIANNAKMTTIDYPCGCSYLFDHHIELQHICSQHESELNIHG
jgi:hypothetical protein